MWMQEPHLKCEHCGTRLEEWDPKQGGNRHAYIPQIFTCPGCEVSGDALSAAKKQANAQGGGHGLRVRLIPDYVVKKQVRERTPAQRRRMQEMEQTKLAEERDGGADIAPRKTASLGGGRRPPPIDSGRSGLDKKPEGNSDNSDTE